MPQSLHVSYERNTLDEKKSLFLCLWLYYDTRKGKKTKIRLFENKNHNQTYIPIRVSQFVKLTVLQSKKK